MDEEHISYLCKEILDIDKKISENSDFSNFKEKNLDSVLICILLAFVESERKQTNLVIKMNLVTLAFSGLVVLLTLASLIDVIYPEIDEWKLISLAILLIGIIIYMWFVNSKLKQYQ